MDNFFAKKGIALSRQPPHSTQFIKQQIIKSQNEIPRQFISQPPKPVFIKVSQNQGGQIPTSTHKMQYAQQNDNSFTIQNPSKSNQQYHMQPKPIYFQKNSSKQLQPEAIPSRQSYFVQQQPVSQRQSFPEMKNQLQSISTDDQTHKNFVMKQLQFEQNTPSKQMNQFLNVSLRSKVQSRKDQSFQTISPRKSITTYEDNQLKRQLQQALLKQKIMAQAMKSLQKQKQELKKRMRDSSSSPTKSYWLDEKIKLLQQLEQKSNYIRGLEIKLQENQREAKVKISMLQYQVKKLQAIKNRQQTDNNNTRKLLEIQRQKNDTAQNQMDKLIFFQDDLIRAKDFNKLKRQLQDVLTQNSKMYQDHQKYILEVGETRRKMNEQLQSVEQQLSRLKGQAFQWRAKIQRLNASGDDKRQLIKLQHDINFLMKKIEQSREQMIQREHSLEEAHQQIKELTQKQNKRIESNQHILDGLNLKQFSDTISLYQSRIEDLNYSLFKSKNETQEQKKTIEKLTSQLRITRQDKHINSMRQRSHESSLKNDLMVLQHMYKSEQELSRKKIAGLEDNVQRKTKEIIEKDKFIKQFLINRAKKIEIESMNGILDSIKAYFHVPPPTIEPKNLYQPVNIEKSRTFEEPQTIVATQNVSQSQSREILMKNEEPQEVPTQISKGVEIDV